MLQPFPYPSHRRDPDLKPSCHPQCVMQSLQLTTVLLIGAIKTVLPPVTQLLLLHTAQHITGHLARATPHGWEGPGADTLTCRQDTTTGCQLTWEPGTLTLFLGQFLEVPNFS